jgi:hypothetical protein
MGLAPFSLPRGAQAALVGRVMGRANARKELSTGLSATDIYQ